MLNANATNGNEVQAAKVFKMYSMKDYLNGYIDRDLDRFAAGSKLKSGYANLDMMTSLYPGLYVIGGISSLGKTTFIHQMADQMAESGHKVIYYSLEQSALELATKSFSRLLAKKDASKALTSLQLRKGGADYIRGVREEYGHYAENIIMPPCGFNTTIEMIEEFVKNCIQQYHIKPVVIVDYLQAINPGDTRRANAREVVDSQVHRLKQLQSENDLVIIVVSSLNRQNYQTQIDFESFKEG